MRARTPLGWQSHHILPRALGYHRQLSPFLRGLAPYGVRLSASDNILLLPAVEHIAAEHGLAMHRGPHPRYSAVITQRVERERQRDDAPHIAAARIVRLQRVMVRVLAGRGPRLLLLNQRDPMRLFSDYDALDSAINRLWGDAIIP